ncbi:baseplate J/gp47 family protein [Salmonella enterica]
MPFKRDTLSELRQRNRQFLQTELKHVGTLLRFSNLQVLADMDAGMSHLHYAYLDYIAKQSIPFTATGEYLAQWMALKKVFRKAASAACSPACQATGTPGAIIPAGAILNRSDGYRYTTDAELKIGNQGTGTVSVTAVLPDITEDVTGGGEAGNADSGTCLMLDTNIAGVKSTMILLEAATGGANIEDEEVFRQRGLMAYQNESQGGNADDYRRWALEVAGVTRAWVAPRLLGANSVGIYIMCDGSDRSNNGFPVGSDGVAAKEQYPYGKAGGDQLRVADYIFPRRPATTVIWVCSPVKKRVDFDIGGIPDADAATVTAIEQAIDEVFFENGEPGGKIFISDLTLAIGALDGTRGFVINRPSGTFIRLGAGELPVRGNITFQGITS